MTEEQVPQRPELEIEDNPRFHDTFYVLYESYQKKRGRTLDAEQVKVVIEAFAEISESANEATRTVEIQDEMIDQLQAKIDKLEAEYEKATETKRKIWTPKK